MNFFKILRLIFWVLILQSCKGSNIENSIEENVISSIVKNCDSNGCSLRLIDFTNFQWDSLYIFKEMSSKEEISDTLGIEYKRNYVPDGYSRMIFIKNNKVAYEEDFGRIAFKKSSITINLPIDTNSFNKVRNVFTSERNFILRDESIFVVRKVKVENSCQTCFSYQLTPKINLGKTVILSD